jgi:hypothetical protein
MQIDFENEHLVPLREVAKLFPGQSGRGVSMATLWRWTIQGRNGIHLEAVSVGGRKYTTHAAVKRWLERCNPSQLSGPSQNAKDYRLSAQLEAEGL